MSLVKGKTNLENRGKMWAWKIGIGSFKIQNWLICVFESKRLISQQKSHKSFIPSLANQHAPGFFKLKLLPDKMRSYMKSQALDLFIFSDNLISPHKQHYGGVFKKENYLCVLLKWFLLFSRQCFWVQTSSIT